jgi:hypothetical protein
VYIYKERERERVTLASTGYYFTQPSGNYKSPDSSRNFSRSTPGRDRGTSRSIFRRQRLSSKSTCKTIPERDRGTIRSTSCRARGVSMRTLGETGALTGATL